MNGSRCHVLKKLCPPILAILVFLSGCVTQAPSPLARTEANDLFHFTQFVEWPADSFADPNAPLVIGVLGGNPFGIELDKAIGRRRINGHPVVLRQLTPLSNLKRYQVVFIDHSVAFRLPLIFYSATGGHTLTVSDAPGFVKAGGMIGFFTENDKVRFEINRTAVENAGLKINSELWMMAGHPTGGGAEKRH